MAQSACFVAEVDFTVPKVIVEKAHHLLSQSRGCRKASSACSKVAPSCTAPDKAHRRKVTRCPAREAAPHGTPRCQGPLSPRPPSQDNFRTLTPPLRVKGISLPNGGGELQSSTTVTRCSSPVSILHSDTCEREFEVQGVQLLHEPLPSVLESDISLKGLVWNHAHSYLVPRSPDHGAPQPAGSPANRRERNMKVASAASPSCPRMSPGVGDHTVVSRTSVTPHRRKPAQMFGWDDTERGQIPAVSAFYEGGVNSMDTFAAAGSVVLSEIWDYVGPTHIVQHAGDKV